MPTYKVTDPESGRSVKLTGDSPPTEAELEEIFASLPPKQEPKKRGLGENPRLAQRGSIDDSEVSQILSGIPEDVSNKIISEFSSDKGIPAGKRDALKRKASLERLRLENPFMAEDIENMSDFKSFMIGTGKGFATVGRGLGLMDKETEGEKAAFDALSQSRLSAPIGELAGESAPFLPLGLGAGSLRTLGGRALAGAGVGGAEGNILARGKGGDEESVLLGTVLGAGIGGGAEVVLPYLSRISRKIYSSVKGESTTPVITPDGKPTPEFQEVLDSQGISYDDVIAQAREEAIEGGPISPEQVARNQQRQEAFETLDVPFTEAERTRDKSLFADQVSQSRKSSKIQELSEDREVRLSQRFDREVSNTGGDPILANETPINAIVRKAEDLDDEISSLYKSARSRASGEKNIRFNKASGVLRGSAPDNELSGGVISSLKGMMQQMGVLDKNFRPVGRVNVEQAERLRKKANELWTSTNATGKNILSRFKNALDDDVFSVAGEDVFNQARKAKADFESGLSHTKKHRFDESKVSLVRDILNNVVEPDDIAKGKLIKATSKYKASHLAELKNYLMSGKEQHVSDGIKAWNDIRSSALQFIKDESFTGPVGERGVNTLSRAKLEGAIKKIGSEKFRVLFTEKERSFIRDLARVAALKEPPAGTFSPSGPAIEQIESKIDNIMGVGWLFRASKDKLTEAKLLKIADDAERLEKEYRKRAMDAFRRSKPVEVITAASTAGAVSSNTDSNKE